MWAPRAAVLLASLLLLFMRSRFYCFPCLCPLTDFMFCYSGFGNDGAADERGSRQPQSTTAGMSFSFIAEQLSQFLALAVVVENLLFGSPLPLSYLRLVARFSPGPKWLQFYSFLFFVLLLYLSNSNRFFDCPRFTPLAEFIFCCLGSWFDATDERGSRQLQTPASGECQHII